MNKPCDSETRMEILCLGISHHTAPVSLRERLNFAPVALKAPLARFGCERATPPAGINELVILSTCNRLELYAALPAEPSADHREAGFARLMRFLVETHELPVDELSDPFYRLLGQAAIEALGRVACGLDAMVLGEPQILGQVTDAYSLALSQGAAGPVLAALFRAAAQAGKRARTETGISRNPATISPVAVKMAEQAVATLSGARPLSDCRVLIVGAGEMAELAVAALRARGAVHLTVVNRTQARAASMAGRWGARALTFEHLSEAIAQADIALTFTDAPHFVITPEVAGPALAERPERPLVLIDIAMPRDVDPAVRRLANVRYYDLDNLEAHLNGALADRQLAVPRVQAIAAEEMQRFSNWLSGLKITPLIVGLHAKADAILRVEVDKTFRRLPDLTDAERAQIEILAQSLVTKLLHEPTRRLKAEANQGQAADCAAAVRYLFALDVSTAEARPIQMPHYWQTWLDLGPRQTDSVCTALSEDWPSAEYRLKPTITSGDRLPDRLPPEIGVRGVFTEEIESALQIWEINLAVHSLKDLPINDTPDLVLRAIASRDDGQRVPLSCGPIRTVICHPGRWGL
jgi:glutamyl-tRNA reductase